VLSLPLYALNFVVFGLIGGFRGSELHIFIAHLMFALFFSVAYRALAVPAPRRKA